jgi:hypothetical protein
LQKPVDDDVRDRDIVDLEGERTDGGRDSNLRPWGYEF